MSGCTHVSCVPKKKIGILLGGGLTAPSATSSIWEKNRTFNKHITFSVDRRLVIVYDCTDVWENKPSIVYQVYRVYNKHVLTQREKYAS